jgi:hypothetical protein
MAFTDYFGVILFTHCRHSQNIITALSEILVPRFCGGSKIAKKKKIRKY